MKTAPENAEAVTAVFLETQRVHAGPHGTPALLEHLEQVESEFRSVAYESASMAIALDGFATDTFPRDWLLFANGPAAAHKAQVYVGLGWAIAKSNFPFLTAVQKTDARFSFRVADGCGFYDGSFRRRLAVGGNQPPAYLPETAMSMYDQGVGRSLWYTERADLQKVRSALETFAVSRQADLWRGVGVAAAYAGGSDDAALRLLFQYAGAHGIQLARGAALAARSRAAANAMTDDTGRCSRLWFALARGDGAADEERYRDWLQQTEERLAAAFRS